MTADAKGPPKPSAWLIGEDATTCEDRAWSYAKAHGASVHPNPDSIAPPLYTLDASREMCARELGAIVEEQSRDDGLWFIAERATEAYLQAALRRLHAAVERAER